VTVESIHRLADRCLLPGFIGTVAPDWVLRRTAAGLGGVCLYARNIETPEQLAVLTASLHAERPDLLIAIDEEGGDVTRLEARTGSSYPGNLALGAVDDIVLTRSVARAMGADLATAGIDLDLAPVADVNSNPINPVIGVRAFGAQAAQVARQTAAWVAGLEEAGVAACVKHFPGHGDTSVDSHLALPVVNDDPHASGALEPFRAAIAAGVRSVMSAHIVVPSLDSVPATISTKVMTALLRGELGFEGLAVSDGLEMRAIADGVGIVEGTVLALAAGCDLLCIGGGLAGEDITLELRDAIVAAVKAGRLSEERLAEAAARVDRLAAWRRQQGGTVARNPGIGLAAARRAIKVEGSVRVAGNPVVVQLRSTPSQAAGVVPWGVADPLARLGALVTAIEIDAPPQNLEAVLGEAATRSLVLVVRNLHRHPWMAALTEAVLSQRPDTILVEMGLPACRPLAAAAYLATHGASRVSGIAAAEALLGR
jgi:beta-N-acetylhexosaminidase